MKPPSDAVPFFGGPSKIGGRNGRGAKRVFDLSAALSCLLLMAPLIVTLAIVLLIVQGRPIFIKHKRVGRSGTPFSCFKFRTMVVNGDEVLQLHLRDNSAAREEWDRSRKLKNDPRVTPLGRVLRTSSVDEVPQLLNIVRGDMSVVGPRPIVESEIPFYGPSIHYYYRVRPGLTGPWQVSGRSDTCYETRVKLDVDYVQSRNILRDVAIVLRTVPAVIKSRGSY